jgi:hypothetical protein
MHNHASRAGRRGANDYDCRTADTVAGVKQARAYPIWAAAALALLSILAPSMAESDSFNIGVPAVVMARGGPAGSTSRSICQPGGT